MAWDGHSDRVGGAGAGYGAGSIGHSNFFGDRTIGASFAARDLLQDFPDTALERCRPDVKRERRVGILIAALNQLIKFLAPLVHGFIVATPGGERELAHQSLLEFF